MYVSKGERVQYECLVHHCLSRFLQEKTNLERFFLSSCFELCFTKNLKPGSYVRRDVNSNKKKSRLISNQNLIPVVLEYVV